MVAALVFVFSIMQVASYHALRATILRRTDKRILDFAACTVSAAIFTASLGPKPVYLKIDGPWLDVDC